VTSDLGARAAVFPGGKAEVCAIPIGERV
jgi:hypothetical protein